MKHLTTTPYFRTILKNAYIVLPISIMYIILGPIEICFGNQAQFMFKWSDIWWEFCIVAAIGVIVFSIVVTLLPEIFRQILHTVLFSVTIASYVQYLFLNVKLVNSNGDRINWISAEMKKISIINLIIWFLIIVCIVLLDRKTRMREFKYSISLLLSVVLILAVIASWMGFEHDTGDKTTIIMTDYEEYEVNPENNIIVLVLDQYSSRLFKNAVKVNPEIEKELKDFTYYNEANSEWANTFPSMTHLLTATDFSPDYETTGEWARYAWNRESTEKFYSHLQNKGYDCRIYSSESVIYGGGESLEKYFNNVKPVRYSVRLAYVPIKLVKMSTYRYLPYILKPYFEVLTSEFDNTIFYEGCYNADNIVFYNELKDKGITISDSGYENGLIVYHLRGAHNPPYMDRDLNPLDEKVATRLEMGLGCMKLVSEYIDQLKSIGKYDDSTIIVMSDHGILSDEYKDGLEPLPIFIMKRPYDNAKILTYSDTVVEYDDFCATILDLIGVKDDSIPGTSIFTDHIIGKRMIYYPENDPNYPDVESSSVNVYHGYEINGGDDSIIEKYHNNTPDDVINALPMRW